MKLQLKTPVEDKVKSTPKPVKIHKEKATVPSPEKAEEVKSEVVEEKNTQVKKPIQNVNHKANQNNPNHPSFKKTNPAAAAPISPVKKQSSKPSFRDPDYEFDGIIESEGVLEMMPDGYGFLTFFRL